MNNCLDDRYISNNFRNKPEGLGNDNIYERNNDDKYERKETIKNKSILEVQGCKKKFIIESNEVEAKKIKLRIKEEQSCNLAFEGEEIEYKVKICNDSDADIFNCEFKDFLDRNTEYERNSFKVNGKHETPCVKDNVITFNIPKLCDHSETTITFEAKVK